MNVITHMLYQSTYFKTMLGAANLQYLYSFKPLFFRIEIFKGILKRLVERDFEKTMVYNFVSLRLI
ncbi:hypothetical protein HNR77_003850 [Paenibacillus sp. JGP012]|nr:hypothetical protein [Paenibacillus sp. JGP012]